MRPTDPTMQQIVRMVQAGWYISFYPDDPDEGGMVAEKIDHPVIHVDNEGWQDDIPAAWARLVAAWERQVGDAND